MARIHKRTVQKRSNDLDNPDGVVTHLEPDIQKCEVKWALGSITNNKAGGIPVELFQILKDDAVKVLRSIYQQILKTPVATGLEKVSFHFNPKDRQCQRIFKLLHNFTHLTCWESNAQNSPSAAKTFCEPRPSRSTS